MVSRPQSKLPIIDMTDLKPGSESWITTGQRVTHALEEYGCFMAIYGGFPQTLYKDVFDALKKLFDLPTETKMQNISDMPSHGYLGFPPDRLLFESMGIGNATSLDDVKRVTNLMWPSGNDHFSKTMHSLAKLVSELDSMVRKMVFECYGVEKYHEAYNESMCHLLRLMKYRPVKEDEGNLALSTHTDKSFLTILNQNQVEGLEVHIKDDEWVTAEYLPSSFLVMASDAFMAWSNGRLRSTRHRVFMNGKEDRYSLALFSFKKEMVEIPEELIDDEHPRKFKSFDNFKLLDFFAKNPIYLNESAVVAYCGI